MSEDGETPKVEDKSERPHQTRSVDPHKEIFAEVIVKAQHANDARSVEADGEKAGLSGALAARMDSMNKSLDYLAQTRSAPLKGILSPLNLTVLMVESLATRPIARLGAKATGMIRDRLQPAVNKDSSGKSK